MEAFIPIYRGRPVAVGFVLDAKTAGRRARHFDASAFFSGRARCGSGLPSFGSITL